MDVVELNLRYQNHAERIFFAVTNLGKQNVIMGHTWLRKHNPDINWVTGDVKMSAAPKDAVLAVETRSVKKGENEKSRPVILRTALKERFLTLTKMMRMTKTQMRKSKMVTESSPPVYINLRRKSARPPPSLNAWWKPSNGTETLPILKKAPPF